MAESKDNTIYKTFEYKLRPNAQFVKACEKTLDDSRFIYNNALEHRISIYRATGQSVGLYEQSRQLTDARKALPEVGTVLRTIQSDALERLDEAFKSFFRRLKNGEKPGFPRFKGKDRYHTFSQKIEKQRACPLNGDKLTVPGVGSCRVRLSRLIEGRCVQLRITRRADGWYCLLVCEIPKPAPLPKTGETVGVDVGITHFATLSTGEKIENPRHLKKSADNLAKHQRRLSRKKKGSKNRAKARNKVALAHLKVTRARKDFHHQTAKNLVDRFDRIAVEDLNIKGMVKNHSLAKAISDVAWSAFFLILISKAVNAGRQVIKVPAAYTSQTCNRCGHRQKMPLKLRTFVCGNCSHALDRDENAARNIVGLSEPEHNACGVGRPTMKQERAGSSAFPLLTRR